MVPEGWQLIKLGKVFKSRREKGQGGLPTLSVTLNDGLVLRESLERKMETNLSAEEHLLVRKNDLAYNMMRMWQGASGLAYFDALVSPAYVVLKPTHQIDPLFASYLFKSDRMIYLFWAYSYGLTSDRLRLYFADFSAIPVALPPIQEQRRIAEILGAWDRAIDKVLRLIDNNQALKHSLMQKLLTGAQRLKNSVEEWTEFSVKEMGQIVGGGTPDIDDARYWGGDIQWATPTDVTSLKSRFITTTERALTKAGLQNSAARLLPVGSVLVCTRATIGECAIAASPLTTNQGFKSLIPSVNFDSDFLFYLFQFFKRTFIKKACGSTFLELSKSDFAKERFKIPKIDEQRRIAAILNTCETEKKSLLAYLDRLEEQKRGVLQQLLTGKQRVSVGDGAEPMAAIG